MKKPEIKSWDCVDHDPIEKWIPEDPSEVEFWLNIAVGIVGEEGTNNFLVHVVTERKVSSVANKSHMLVIPYYSGLSEVLTKINTTLECCNGLNWSDISEQIAKLYKWEYEGMQ
jgi:hypothetical protein